MLALDAVGLLVNVGSPQYIPSRQFILAEQGSHFLWHEPPGMCVRYSIASRGKCRMQKMRIESKRKLLFDKNPQIHFSLQSRIGES